MVVQACLNIGRQALIAIKPSGKPDETEADDPERYTALYDPDTVYPARLAEPPPASSQTQAPEPTGGGGLYAESEKRRVATPLTPDMVKRIADRAERNAARTRRR